MYLIILLLLLVLRLILWCHLTTSIIILQQANPSYAIRVIPVFRRLLDITCSTTELLRQSATQKSFWYFSYLPTKASSQSSAFVWLIFSTRQHLQHRCFLDIQLFANKTFIPVVWFLSGSFAARQATFTRHCLKCSFTQWIVLVIKHPLVWFKHGLVWNRKISWKSLQMNHAVKASQKRADEQKHIFWRYQELFIYFF